VVMFSSMTTTMRKEYRFPIEERRKILSLSTTKREKEEMIDGFPRSELASDESPVECICIFEAGITEREVSHFSRINFVG